jgi:hypothetical protein
VGGSGGGVGFLGVNLRLWEGGDEGGERDGPLSVAVVGGAVEGREKGGNFFI